MSAEDGFNATGRGIIETLLAHPDEFGLPVPLDRLPSRPPCPGLPEFVLEREAGLLPGQPPAASFSLALPVTDFGKTGCLAWIFGPPMQEAARTGHPCDFMQIILVQSSDKPSRPLLSAVSSLRSLAGCLPGYMAHSVGGETTARVHRDLLAAGFTMEHIAGAHISQARERGFDGTIIVAVGIPSRRAMELIAPFGDTVRGIVADLSATAAEASRTGGAGVEGCEGRVCGDCDERDVCDKVRAVLKKYPGGAAKRGIQ